MRNEFTFLVSVRVPQTGGPFGISETFASQRSDPCSIRTSETPSALHNLTKRLHVGRPTSGASAPVPVRVW